MRSKVLGEPPEIGPHLKLVRTRRKMKLKEVAEAAGMSPSALSHIESGHRAPKGATIFRILDGMGATWGDLDNEMGEARMGP